MNGLNREIQMPSPFANGLILQVVGEYGIKLDKLAEVYPEVATQRTAARKKLLEELISVRCGQLMLGAPPALRAKIQKVCVENGNQYEPVAAVVLRILRYQLHAHPYLDRNELSSMTTVPFTFLKIAEQMVVGNKANEKAYYESFLHEILPQEDLARQYRKEFAALREIACLYDENKLIGFKNWLIEYKDSPLIERIKSISGYGFLQLIPISSSQLTDLECQEILERASNRNVVHIVSEALATPAVLDRVSLAGTGMAAKCASLSGSAECLNLFLNYYLNLPPEALDLFFQTDFQLIIRYTVQSGHAECLEMCLDAPEKLAWVDSHFYITLFYEAIQGNKVECLEILTDTPQKLERISHSDYGNFCVSALRHGKVDFKENTGDPQCFEVLTNTPEKRARIEAINARFQDILLRDIPSALEQRCF